MEISQKTTKKIFLELSTEQKIDKTTMPTHLWNSMVSVSFSLLLYFLPTKEAERLGSRWTLWNKKQKENVPNDRIMSDVQCIGGAPCQGRLKSGGADRFLVI
ncbi:unnamed protein product [Callosobruchus maculatus]|uniref:Uncharacterized protein n=1 Tax=Callosobruchus maculatus TaxID=64391 RepID=A0A653DX86_CALMS|nr:unnamed protein product [Callosobruchus maculatus]